MIEAAGITLREAIEAILVIFIMVTYVKRVGEEWKKKYIYRGAYLAVGLSILLAVVLSFVGINPENEAIEGTLFLFAGVLVAGLVVWMWKHAHNIKFEIEKKVKSAGSGFALGFIAFLMVLREGVETVIFLQSLLLAGSSPVENFVGGLLGLALAIAFGVIFLKGTLRINLSLFFKITSAILAILVVKLLANGFHEFFEIGLLPSTQSLLLFVGFFARSGTGSLIIALMLLLLLSMVIIDLVKAPKPELSNLKPVERRKVLYEITREKYSKIGLSFVFMIVILVLLSPTIMASGLTNPEPIPVEVQEGTIVVDVPTMDGLYKYSYQDARVLVAVQNGEIHAALDWCYICPPKGYAYNGEVLICINCEAPIEIATVGNPGGCNPRVLPYQQEGSKIIIDAQTLLNNWQEE